MIEIDDRRVRGMAALVGIAALSALPDVKTKKEKR